MYDMFLFCALASSLRCSLLSAAAQNARAMNNSAEVQELSNRITAAVVQVNIAQATMVTTLAALIPPDSVTEDTLNEIQVSSYMYMAT